MKLLFFVTVSTLWVLGVSGCSNETMDNPYSEQDQKVLMTMQVVGPQTRANYTENGDKMNFSWNNGDAISVAVHDVPNNGNCRMNATKNDKTSPFTGSVSAWKGAPKTIYAFYPYSAYGYKINDGDNAEIATTSLTLPNPQRYTIGGPVDNSFMVGVGSANVNGNEVNASATLHQVMSIIQLNISNASEKLTEVKLKCSKPIFPTTATVKLSDGTISNLGGYVDELTMKVTDETDNKNKTVSFAMLPVDLKAIDVNIQVIFNYGSYISINKSGIAFSRNTHYMMGLDATQSSNLYIKIGNVKWATGNLVADGENRAKIGLPTDGGLYFQFGSLLGWSGGATGDGTGRASNSYPQLKLMVSPKDYAYSSSWPSEWEGDTTKDNADKGTGDPCRFYLGGTWRTPTQAEYMALLAGVESLGSGPWKIGGSFYGGSTNSSAEHTSGLKFPAAGWRGYYGNSFSFVGSAGGYWSSTSGSYLGFSLGGLRADQYISHSYGFIVRCVCD